jgi:hypothetical protein
MKRNSTSGSAFFNLHVSIVLIVFLTGVFISLFATADPWEVARQAGVQVHRPNQVPLASSGDVNEAWVARYNGPENSGDYATAMVVDSLGNVYVTGHSNRSDTSSDYATIKYVQTPPRPIPTPRPRPTPHSRPNTIMVTNGNDSGPGSLRQAVSDASNGYMIQFAPRVTNVALTSGQITIGVSLSIIGPGANTLMIGSSPSGVFLASTNTTTISISGLTIADSGGGISSNGRMTINQCVISSNTSTAITNTGTMSIVDSTISNNAFGGVINDGSMTITRCTISGNSASLGGGINNNSGSLTITNSTINDNVASNNPGQGTGGGIFNNAAMTISNCTISGNLAGGSPFGDGAGGGIGNTGNLEILSSTVANNSASGLMVASGGGIVGVGSTIADSTVIALNSVFGARNDFGPDLSGTLQSMGYNIIGNNDGASISSQPTDQIGTPGAPIDPRLGPLAHNGGPTFTQALQAGSPAINRGDPAAPPQDQRGYARVGLPDVGAFEFQGIVQRYDFDGDGKPDYVLTDASTRLTAIWYLDCSQCSQTIETAISIKQ